MHESRRAFLGLTFGFAAASAFAAVPQQRPMPDRPGIPESMQPPPYRFPQRNPKIELQIDQEKIKKDVTRLSQLAQELRDGLDSSDTKHVLSIDVIRKAEEIEKLAKRIRETVRG